MERDGDIAFVFVFLLSCCELVLKCIVMAISSCIALMSGVFLFLTEKTSIINDALQFTSLISGEMELV